jgi:3-deoxy-manno-octulosonate cytidylyltransferase (CMP-KDO synthetase)
MNYRIFVPARLGSSRLENKPLIEINGKTVIQRCLEQCPSRPILVCPTDDAAAILRGIDHSVKFDLILTERTHEKNIHCGTDRIAMAVEQYPNLMEGVDIAINLQGDNVVYPQSIFDQLALFHESIKERMDGEVRSFISTVVSPKASNNSVIAIMGEEDRVITFFRPMGYERLCSFPGHYHLHRGIYCYSQKALKHWLLLRPTEIEQQEKLEQMRWIVHRLPIYAMVNNEPWLDINTIANVEYARKVLK